MIKIKTKSVRLAAVSLLAFVLMTQVAIPAESDSKKNKFGQKRVTLVNMKFN